MTNPSRERVKGRLAFSGSSFLVERARITAKAPMAMGVMAASVPPARTRSASPSWIMRRALPRASAPVAQAVTTVEEGPVKP